MDASPGLKSHPLLVSDDSVSPGEVRVLVGAHDVIDQGGNSPTVRVIQCLDAFVAVSSEQPGKLRISDDQYSPRGDVSSTELAPTDRRTSWR
jgi:hypothetical protein